MTLSLPVLRELFTMWSIECPNCGSSVAPLLVGGRHTDSPYVMCLRYPDRLTGEMLGCAWNESLANLWDEAMAEVAAVLEPFAQRYLIARDWVENGGDEMLDMTKIQIVEKEFQHAAELYKELTQ